MNRILPPVNRPGLPQKPYTPEKPKVAKAMTIAVGLFCNNGNDLVIASDRQFTVDGFYKKYAKKLVSDGCDLVYGFSGEQGLYAEARQKIGAGLGLIKPVDTSLEIIQETTIKVLDSMGLLNRELQTRRLFMFIGYNEGFEKPRLLVFDGQAVYESENGFEVIGCGDTSVIHFLTDHLYAPDLSPKQGIALAAYLVKKATRHIDKVDGPIDVEHADGLSFQTVSPETVNAGVALIEEQEQFLPILMIQKPFQP